MMLGQLLKTWFHGIVLLQVKNLFTVHPDNEVPVKRVAIRKIPR